MSDYDASRGPDLNASGGSLLPRPINSQGGADDYNRSQHSRDVDREKESSRSKEMEGARSRERDTGLAWGSRDTYRDWERDRERDRSNDRDREGDGGKDRDSRRGRADRVLNHRDRDGGHMKRRDPDITRNKEADGFHKSRDYYRRKNSDKDRDEKHRKRSRSRSKSKMPSGFDMGPTPTILASVPPVPGQVPGAVPAVSPLTRRAHSRDGDKEKESSRSKEKEGDRGREGDMDRYQGSGDRDKDMDRERNKERDRGREDRHHSARRDPQRTNDKEVVDGKPVLQLSSAVTPSSVLCLTEVVAAKVAPDYLKEGKAYEEMIVERRAKFRVFGDVVRLVIPQLNPSGEPAPGFGKVFVKYADVETSSKALLGLNGGEFGGNQVLATFYPEEKFRKEEYDG